MQFVVHSATLQNTPAPCPSQTQPTALSFLQMLHADGGDATTVAIEQQTGFAWMPANVRAQALEALDYVTCDSDTVLISLPGACS